jgi:acetaldehyde dehydrogenase (acetylating)
MLRALDASLRHHPWREAQSGQGAWQEIQRLVEMDARAGRVLARRFRQNAVLVLKPHQPPLLVILARAP